MEKSNLKRVKSKDELFKLKKGCSVWKPENLEPDVDKSFFIYSPYSKTYYASEVTDHTDFEFLEAYIREGNVYTP